MPPFESFNAVPFKSGDQMPVGCATRREWLLASAAALTFATAPAWPANVLRGAEPEASSSENQENCTLGFSTYGMPRLATERALQLLADIGFDAVEISVRADWDADSAELNEERRRTLQKQLRDLPLRLTSLMEHVHPGDTKQQAAALERLKLATQVAHDLSPDKPPVVQTVLGGGKWEEKKHGLVESLADWAKLAEATKTIIALKPHRGGVLSQPSEAVWLLQQLGKPPWLRMVFDYSHYAYRDLPLEETIRTALPYTAHVVVKDAAKQNGQVVFKLPGEAGTLDYPILFRQFYAGGYRGDFNCEVSGMVSGQPGYDPIVAAKLCYANMTQALQQAGIQRPQE